LATMAALIGDRPKPFREVPRFGPAARYIGHHA